MNTNTAEQTRTEHEKLLDWLASGSVTNGLGCAGLIMAAAAEHNALLAQRDALAVNLGRLARIIESRCSPQDTEAMLMLSEARKLLPDPE